MKDKRVNMGMFYVITIMSLVFYLTVATVIAQEETEVKPTEAAQTTAEVMQKETAKTDIQKTEKPAVLQPMVTEYKGIKIGTTADEVRELLDEKPEVADNNGFYYIFSDREAVQISLDADKKVKMIATIYMGEKAEAPKFADVFGSEMTVEKQENGRIYQQVNYPDAGYWVSYSRIMIEEKPMVTVTMQKMP